MVSPTTETRTTPLRPRYDPLAEFNRAAGPPIDAGRATRGIFGAALVTIGVGICIWAIVLIHRTLNGPSDLALLRKVMPLKPEDLAMTVPGGTIQFPPATLTIIAYFLAFLFLAIAGKIAVAILREGSQLLRSPKPGTDTADDLASRL